MGELKVIIDEASVEQYNGKVVDENNKTKVEFSFKVFFDPLIDGIDYNITIDGEVDEETIDEIYDNVREFINKRM